MPHTQLNKKQNNEQQNKKQNNFLFSLNNKNIQIPKKKRQILFWDETCGLSSVHCKGSADMPGSGAVTGSLPQSGSNVPILHSLCRNVFT